MSCLGHLLPDSHHVFDLDIPSTSGGCAPILPLLRECLVPSSTLQPPCSMATIWSYAPNADILSQVALLQVLNSLKVYSSPHPEHKASSTTPTMTPSFDPHSSEPNGEFHSRTIATFATVSAITRLHMAFNIHDPKIYQLNVMTQAVLVAHLVSEWLVYGSSSWGLGLTGPATTNSLLLSWMVWDWAGYVS